MVGARANVVLALCAAAFIVACSELRVAETADGGGTASSSSGGASTSSGNTGSSSGTPNETNDAGADASKGPQYYDDVQKALAAKRFPGPTTAQGSRGYCTPKYFVWRESDGTIHSWAGKTQARIDYAWKAEGTRSYFVPADALIAADFLPSYSKIDVYDTTAANSHIGSLPYAFNFVSANDGVIRLDQKVDNVDVGGTKVRRWVRATGNTEDITNVLSTREPPSSFVNDMLVIPGGITIPYALYLVDVAKKTTGSVTFDGALALQQTERANDGLFVWYTRSGAAGSALRVYKNLQDDAASRFELGDELANRANYFVDGPMLEHKFLARIATWKRRVLYGSAYGIWAYDFVTATFAPVQLAPNKTTAVPDVMCVLTAEDLLVYRTTNDTVGQIWAVPLGSVLQ
jgi:hypothetical protein